MDKYGTNASWIVKWYGKIWKKSKLKFWNNMENTEERQVE